MGLLELDLERPFASVEGGDGLFVKLEAPSGWVFQARRGRKLPSSSPATRKKWQELLRHFYLSRASATPYPRQLLQIMSSLSHLTPSVLPSQEA